MFNCKPCTVVFAIVGDCEMPLTGALQSSRPCIKAKKGKGKQKASSKCDISRQVSMADRREYGEIASSRLKKQWLPKQSLETEKGKYEDQDLTRIYTCRKR